MVAGCLGIAASALSGFTNGHASPNGCVAPNGTASASCFGFDRLDSTAHLQAALDSNATTLIIDALGEPWVTQPLFVRRPNLTVVLAAPVHARRGYFHGNSDTLLSFGHFGSESHCDGSRLLGAGGHLKMWRADYDNASAYVHSEHRHGVQFVGCRDIEVAGVAIQETGGDGIYLRDVTAARLVRSSIHGAYRNGVSIISGHQLLLEDLEIVDVNGTAPRSGVDLEPNQPEDTLANITMRRVRVARVGGCGIEVKHAWAHNLSAPVPVGVVIDSCSVSGADRTGLAVAPVARGAQGTVAVTNMTIEDCRCAGLVVGSKAVESARLSLENVSLVNTSYGCDPSLAISYGSAPIYLGVHHVTGVGKQRWAQGQLFGNAFFGGGVHVGSSTRPLPEGAQAFLAASQELPDTGADHGPPTDPAIFDRVAGTVSVHTRDRAACTPSLGKTGVKVEATAVCNVVS